MKTKLIFCLSICLTTLLLSTSAFSQTIRFANLTGCSISVTAYYGDVAACSSTGSNFHSFIANEVYVFPAPPSGDGYIILDMTGGPSIGLCGAYSTSATHSCGGEPTDYFFNQIPSPTAHGTAYHIYQ